MHKALLDTVMQEEGTGTPCSLTTSHVAIDASPEEGTVFFANGDSVSADLVIAADGIRSRIRSAIGITPEVEGSTSCCYRCIIAADKLRELGLEDFVSSETIQFWGGFGINKVVMGACHGGELVSCYCFYP
jgi:salicylate hydroxylase